MPYSPLLDALQSHVLFVLLGLIVLRLAWGRFGGRLSGIPGPALAKCTRLWKLRSDQYGSLVRIGPRHVSVGDPAAITVIYGLNKGFTKVHGLLPYTVHVLEQATTNEPFSTRDARFHRDQKRPVANAYSMTSLLEMAPANKPVDLGTWLQYYAFDVVGEFPFGKKLGFLQEGRDVDAMIEGIQGILAYASLCGQVPEMHKALLGNPLFPLLMPSMESWNQMLQFTLKMVNSRASVQRDGELEEADLKTGKDMLSRWMAIHYADPSKMSTRDVIVHLSTNVFAGSDTTAIALRAILYFLLRHPRIMDKVVGEIDEADRQGYLTSPISYRELTTYLPYLCAFIKEAMRLHPSVGLILERHVPKGRHHFGINARVLHNNPRVFPDPESFVPERWHESSPERLKEMEQSFFVFGAGSRTCVGKNIFLIEMHKIIPQLLRDFTI
ncbi:cytochrome P450 [Aspergillus pseudoustus]|uniref:Cytochrome P450 n=1 Tax=Aspergillus pseudoustus TaxID=1810923 RepID=A0ABR4JD81_9EURO